MLWKDDWKAYSTKDRSAFAALAYETLKTVPPNEYVATAGADLITVSGLVNNVVYGVDRFDNIKFTDLYLESFALFYKLRGKCRLRRHDFQPGDGHAPVPHGQCHAVVDFRKRFERNLQP